MTLINNRFALLVCAILSSFFLIASCDEDDKCNAGTGGNVVLVTKPQHHGNRSYYQRRPLRVPRSTNQRFQGNPKK